MLPPPDDLPLNARAAALEAGLSLPAFYRAVRDGTLPAPVYPAPRAPRWYRSEIRDALAKTRARPTDAVAARRKAALDLLGQMLSTAKVIPAGAHE